MTAGDVPVQTFAAEPTDAQLAGLLDPAGRSISVRVEDTPDRVAALPRGYSMWFVVGCVTVPFLVFIGIAVYDVVHGQRDVTWLAFYCAALLSGCGAFAFYVALFRWMNRKLIDRGPFFVLDKAR